MDETEGVSVTARYAYLLQPIRDLEANFNVNIQTVLERYCEGLPDEQRTNFVEAAMLLQGTATVYCRKVEYVYQLVLNAANNLFADRKKKKGGKDGDAMGDGEGGNDDDGEVETPDDPCELLDLDRRLRAGKNLRLSPGTPTMPHPVRDASNTLHSGNFTMPMKPMSLIPLADFEKVNVPLYSRRNNKEIIGKKDDFRVNTAHVLKQGPLLLDLINELLLEEFTVFKTVDHISNMLTAVSGMVGDGDKENAPPRDDRLVPNEGDNDSYAGGDVDMDEVDQMTNNEPAEMQRDGTLRTAALTDVNRDDGMRPSCTQLQDLGARPSTILTGMMKPKKEEPTDFNLLDEFALDEWKMCDVKQIRPFVFAEDLLTRRARRAAQFAGTKATKSEIARTRLRPVYFLGEPQMPLQKFIDHSIYKRKIKKDPYEARVPVIDHAMNDNNSDALDFWSGKFHTLAAVASYQIDVQKERAKRRRNAVDGNRERFAPGEKRRTALEQGTATRANDAGDNQPWHFATADDDDVGDLFDDDDFDAELHALDAQHAARDAADGGLAAMLDDSVLRPRLPLQVLADADALVDGDGRAIAEMSYEQQLTHYLKRYWSTSEEKQSAFCQRVLQWEDRMMPILDREQDRREFNIHEYGTELIDAFAGAIGQQKRFNELLPHAERFEVCRYFLSALMLANTYNVHVDGTSTSSDASRSRDGINEMQLTLHNVERYHRRFNQQDGGGNGQEVA